jgi:hypothetical protein
VLAHLVATDSGALTSAELVERLRVSPASVSKAVTYLHGLGVLRRERPATGRRERYVVDDDTWLRAWEVNAQTHAAWADVADEAADALGPQTGAGARLARMGEFFRRLGDDMPAARRPPRWPIRSPRSRRWCTPGGPHDRRAGRRARLARSRVADALREAARHPDVTDPIVVERVPDGRSRPPPGHSGSPRPSAPRCAAVRARGAQLVACHPVDLGLGWAGCIPGFDNPMIIYRSVPHPSRHAPTSCAGRSHRQRVGNPVTQRVATHGQGCDRYRSVGRRCGRCGDRSTHVRPAARLCRNHAA